MAKKEVNIEELVDALSRLSVLEMTKLKSALEEKWGVKAAFPAMSAAPAPASAEEKRKEEESTEFRVTLQEAPQEKKIAIIKVVRAITGLGLKEAKEMVEGVPKVVKERVPKVEAEEISKKLQEVGGKVVSEGL